MCYDWHPGGRIFRRWTLLSPKTFLGIATLAVALALPSMAIAHQDRAWRGHGHGFYPRHDFAAWRGGRWHHARHDGRLGWWWVVGPSWYSYSRPIYPYPRFTGPAYGLPPYRDRVIVERPAAPLGAPPAQSWYYCEDPKGYYPYVSSCRGEWRAVPVTPPGEQGSGD